MDRTGGVTDDNTSLGLCSVKKNMIPWNITLSFLAEESFSICQFNHLWEGCLNLWILALWPDVSSLTSTVSSYFFFDELTYHATNSARHIFFMISGCSGRVLYFPRIPEANTSVSSLVHGPTEVPMHPPPPPPPPVNMHKNTWKPYKVPFISVSVPVQWRWLRFRSKKNLVCA